MNRKTLTILVAAAAIISLAAWWLGQREQARYGLEGTGPVAPGLAAKLSDVDRVRIHPAGAEPFTIALVGGDWVVVERGHYPADTEVLRRELRKIALAERLEAKTARPEYYPRLGVQPVAEAEDTTLQLTVHQGDAVIVDLLIGQSGRSGDYVRLVDDTQAWLADTGFSLPRQVSGWLDKALVDIKRDDVRRIRVVPADGEAYELRKDSRGQAEFALDPPVPEGRDRNIANSNRLGAALSRLRLQDVVLDVPEALDWHRTEFETFDGLKVTALSARDGDQRLLRLSAETVAIPPVEDDNEDDAAPDSAVDQTAGPEELAARINARSEGRTFRVSSYNADALSLAWDVMLRSPPDES